MSKEKRKTAPLLVLCLVFLFNPNINIVDLLPDFVAYFILARMLERPADSAPYFEEARAACLKLAWITLAKFPAFLFIIFVRSRNTFDRDIFPMVTLVFSILEAIFLIGLISNIASALFHLGERSDAASLITPFATGKSGKRTMRPEELRSYSIMFVICKALLTALPEFLMLSTTTSDGTLRPAPLMRYYPASLLAAIALVLIIGGIWLSRALKYAKCVTEEGEFTNALSLLASADAENRFETKTKLRRLNYGFLLLIISSFLSFRLAFRETSDINILPGIFAAGFLLLALYKFKPFVKMSLKPSLISGGIYSLLSLVSIGFAISFHDKYSYSSLISSAEAKSAYTPLIVFSVLELLSLFALLLFFVKFMHAFIEENTGILPSDEAYTKSSQENHRELKIKCNIMAVLAALLGIAKCVDVILSYNVKIIYSDVNNALIPIETSPLPWFGVVITVLAVLYIGYTIYLSGVLKEEYTMKYSKS